MMVAYGSDEQELVCSATIHPPGVASAFKYNRATKDTIHSYHQYFFQNNNKQAVLYTDEGIMAIVLAKERR